MKPTGRQEEEVNKTEKITECEIEKKPGAALTFIIFLGTIVLVWATLYLFFRVVGSIF